MARCLLAACLFVVGVIVLGAYYPSFMPVGDFLLLQWLERAIFRMNSFPLHDPFTAALLLVLDVVFYAVLFRAVVTGIQSIRARRRGDV
jgi:hypothetical protein